MSPVDPTALPTDHDDKHEDEREDGLTVSDAGSSFDDVETSAGGADAVPSTPDSVPRDNHAHNADLPKDDDLLA